MYEIYKINANDTLSSIANNYNTTEEELIKINGISITSKIEPNNLIITPKNENINYEYYTVKKEDNIYQIANKHDIDYKLLLKMNGLDQDDYIYPNQTILLPRKDKKMYLTKEGDTINTLIENFETNIDNLLKNNNTIYLEEDQIIIF